LRAKCLTESTHPDSVRYPTCDANGGDVAGRRPNTGQRIVPSPISEAAAGGRRPADPADDPPTAKPLAGSGTHSWVMARRPEHVVGPSP
jgi:hypothetical protein